MMRRTTRMDLNLFRDEWNLGNEALSQEADSVHDVGLKFETESLGKGAKVELPSRKKEGGR